VHYESTEGHRLHGLRENADSVLDAGRGAEQCHSVLCACALSFVVAFAMPSLPSPAFAERRNCGLTPRLIAVRRPAYVAARPHPVAALRRDRHWRYGPEK
jgi:hypothetical protein